MQPPIARVFGALLPIALLACSDDPAGPDDECVVNSITVTGAPASLAVGATAQLGATIDSDHCSPAPTATWSTSNGGRASVSNSGLVTGAAAGSVTITASAGGKSGTATFDVTAIPVAAVRVTPEEIVIGVGPAHTLVAEALDAGDQVLPGRTVTWTVNGGSGATVSPSGQLTGITAGQSATIRATIEGITADVEVHVVRTRLAFFWNNLSAPGATPVAPSAGYSYNSLGGALAISSNATGSYHASFEGQARENHEREAYFLTAYNAPAGSYCTNAGWGNIAVDVTCFGPTGTPADMRFTVAHVSSASFGGRYGFAWISDGNASIEASTEYRYNAAGGTIYSTRNGTGDYTVRFVGLGRVTASDREGVIVNAYLTTASCQPSGWTSVGRDLDVAVRCFDPAGVAVDARFAVLVVDGPRTGARLGFALADQPTTGAYTPTNSAVRPTGNVLVNFNSAGNYGLAFTGIHRSGDLRETFLISPVGVTAGRCMIHEWDDTANPAEATSILVGCSNAAGVPTNMAFSIVVLQ